MVAARKKGKPAEFDEEQLESAPAEKQPVEGELVDISELERRLAELQEANDALREELEGLKAKGQEYLDGWQRALADFSNYKRRVERDQTINYQNAIGSVVKRYLPVLDDLERALANRPQDGEGASWSNGIELIYRKLVMALEADGVLEMQAEGEPFDPNKHEAISQEPSESHASGEIIDVLQKGYQIGDRVLRPAIVRVAE
jgi:molecular chaperone GrpE